MHPLTCPRDGTELALNATQRSHSCSACQGEFMTNQDLYQKVTEQFHPVIAFHHLSCPNCQGNLQPYHHHSGNLELDCCSACKSVWFDKKEKERFYAFIEKYHAHLHKPKFRTKKRRAALETTLSVEQQLYAEYQKRTGYRGETRIDEVLLQIFLGFPIENNLVPFRLAVMTLLLVGLNIALFIFAIKDTGNAFFPHLAFHPAHDGPIQMITALFSHVGIFHLLGNMYFLYIAGDNVEDLMGPIKFLLFYLLVGVLGFAYYDIFSANSTIPHLGASGAVCGVMGAYLCFFPRVKFSIRFLIFFEFGISCFLLFPAYMLWDWIMCLMGDTQVAYEAHLIGFIAGFLLAYCFKKAHLV